MASIISSVRGTKDLFFESYTHFQDIVRTCFESSAVYGFSPIKTPIFEFSDVFHRLGESSDVVSKETYTFLDRAGTSLTLRPEGTASVVRAVLSNGLTQNMPLKFCYAEPMFRYERPQKGRQRQFHHFGVEFFGPRSAFADAEVILLGWYILKSLKIDHNITLKLNSLGSKLTKETYSKAIVAFLSPLKAKLSQDSQARLVKNPLRILDSKDPTDQEILKKAPQFDAYWENNDRDYFKTVCCILDDAGVAYKKDTTLVRGLDYYNHTTFEFVSQTLNAQPTVIGGGRYDGLVAGMGGPDLPAVGWAMGIERIQLLTIPPLQKVPPGYIIALSYRETAYAFSLAERLRHTGCSVQILYDGSFKKQLKKAASLKAPYVVLCGENEVAQNGAILKDLYTGTQKFFSLDNIVQELRPKQPFDCSPKESVF